MQLQYIIKLNTTLVVPSTYSVHYVTKIKKKKSCLNIFSFTKILDSNKYTSENQENTYPCRKLAWNYTTALSNVIFLGENKTKIKDFRVTKANFSSAIHSLNESL